MFPIKFKETSPSLDRVKSYIELTAVSSRIWNEVRPSYDPVIDVNEGLINTIMCER